MKLYCPLDDAVHECQPTDWSMDRWQLVQCRNCGFIFLKDPPEYELLETQFAWEQTSQAERQRRQEDSPVRSRASDLLKQIRATLWPHRNRLRDMVVTQVSRRQLRQPAILDIGCGSGHLLLEIAEQLQQLDVHPKLIGIEISQFLAKAAREQLNAHETQVLQSSATEGLEQIESQSVDIIVMSSYLEHEARPRAVLEKSRQIIRSDGSIFLKVPNFNSLNRRLRGQKWCGFRFPDHVNYFTPKSLSYAASTTAWHCHQGLFDTLPTSDNMYAKLQPESL